MGFSKSFLQSILGTEKEIDKYYQDNQGFFVNLKGEYFFRKITLEGNYNPEKDPNGGFKMIKF